MEDMIAATEMKDLTDKINILKNKNKFIDIWQLRYTFKKKNYLFLKQENRK